MSITSLLSCVYRGINIRGMAARWWEEEEMLEEVPRLEQVPIVGQRDEVPVVSSYMTYGEIREALLQQA